MAWKKDDRSTFRKTTGKNDTGKYDRPAAGRNDRNNTGRYDKATAGRSDRNDTGRYDKATAGRSDRNDTGKYDRATAGMNKRNYIRKNDKIIKERPEITDTADEQEDGRDKLEGRNSVMEALKSDRAINKIFVAKGEREGSIKQIIALAREKKVVVQEVERAKLDSMSTTRAHQGVIAFVSPKEYVEWEDILKIAEERGEKPFIIVLDEIADPHNLGSILRTADAVGAHGVIIPKRRAVGLNATVSKASAGAIEYVPVARVTNIPQTIDSLKKNNIWIVGTDQTGQKPFYESDLNIPVALVIGSEGEGMGKLVREKCDFVVNIPMKGSISSLNASVAGAIVMYEILRQRSR